MPTETLVGAAGITSLMAGVDPDPQETSPRAATVAIAAITFFIILVGCLVLVILLAQHHTGQVRGIGKILIGSYLAGIT